jgi:hypothetical protein
MGASFSLSSTAIIYEEVQENEREFFGELC